jgi:outer membrane protein assembly factor BamE (lipoprotein component of BamABCDE complex)
MRRFLLSCSCLLMLLGCTSVNTGSTKGNLTLGATQILLVDGKTTKAQVLEWFGSPNVATRDKQGEVWNYTRQGTTSQIKSSSVGAWFLLGAGQVDSAKGHSSSYSFDLLIRFDTNDVAMDHKVLQTAF